MKNSIIDINNLSVYIQSEQILSDINLEVHQNDFLILFGADNCGKSTFFSILMGFASNYTGSVKLFGLSPNRYFAQNKYQVCFVPDDIIIEKNMTIEKYFQFMSYNMENYDKKAEQELCIKYDINVKEQLLNLTYQKNKLTAIIAAICSQPKLLILDEPNNFLDKKTFDDILDDIENLHHNGTAIIISVEKFEHISGYGNKYVYFYDGSIKSSDIIPKDESRAKEVTIPRKYITKGTSLIGRVLQKHKKYITYKFSGDIQKLFYILHKTKCGDCTIKNMSLEDEINHTFAETSNIKGEDE